MALISHCANIDLINRKEKMDIYDQEIIDWINNCPTHKIEVQHADEYGAIFLVNFNNKKEEEEK